MFERRLRAFLLLACLVFGYVSSLQDGTARAADISSDKSVSSIIYRLANPTADECFSPTAAVKALETAFAAAGVVSGAAQILLGGELIVGGGVITFGTAGAGSIVGVPAATIGTFYVVEGLLQGLSSYEKLLYVARPDLEPANHQTIIPSGIGDIVGRLSARVLGEEYGGVMAVAFQLVDTVATLSLLPSNLPKNMDAQGAAAIVKTIVDWIGVPSLMADVLNAVCENFPGIKQLFESSVSSPASPSAGSGAACLSINVDTGNLRSGPGTNYSIVGSGQRGDRFPIVGQNASNDSTWYQVIRSNGQTAWVSSTIVALCPGSGQIPVAATTAPSPQPTVASVWHITWKNQRMSCPEYSATLASVTWFNGYPVNLSTGSNETLIVAGLDAQEIGEKVALTPQGNNRYAGTITVPMPPSFFGGGTVTQTFNLQIQSTTSIEGYETIEHHLAQFPRCHLTNYFTLTR